MENPVGAKQRFTEIDEMKHEDMGATCYKCMLYFTVADALQPDFDHWSGRNPLERERE